MNTGILTIFAPVGLLYYVKKRWSFEVFFFLFTFFVLFLFVGDIKFIRPYLTIFLCILIINGLYELLSVVFHSEKVNLICIVLIIFSLILPSLVVINSNSGAYNHTSAWVDDETISTSLYVEEYTGNSALISNDGIIGRRVFAYSGNFVIQDSGIPSYPAYGFVTNNVTAIILDARDINIFEFLEADQTESLWKVDDWLSSGGWYSQLHGKRIYSLEVDNNINFNYHSYYNIRYALISAETNFSIPLEEEYSRQTSPYFYSVVENRYKLYQGNLENVYVL